MEATQPTEAAPATARKQRPRFRRWFVAAAGLVLVVAIGIALLAAKWPFTQQALTSTLEHRFARQVVIHHFQKTYFPPGCIADQVDFLHRKHKNLPPLISVGKLVVRGSYSGLLPWNKHVPQVEVVGLHVTVPPKSSGGTNKVMPLTDNESNVPINDLKVDGAVLDFLSDKPGKQPFQVFLHQMVLDNVGGKGAIRYRASLKNTEPPGEVLASGEFGPWQSEDPGSTPISGSYKYNDVNLGVFGGISGQLSSEGKFQGSLAKLDCDGTADVRNFHVSGDGQAVHLSSQFHANVDAVNGDTFLESVRAGFLSTEIVSKGSVTGHPSGHGKEAVLDFAINRGRIDDLLRLFAHSKQPSMTGQVSLHGKADLPPGKAKFLERLILDGDFGISNGRFTRAAVQDPINHVSESARGESKKQEMEDPSTVLSNLKGHVSAKGGVATLSNISFTVPGGSARMKGTFNLLSHQLNIQGVLYTDGKLSDATSGFKALVLKAVTPFMKKKKTTIVPFTITGTSRDPKFDLDFDGKRTL